MVRRAPSNAIGDIGTSSVSFEGFSYSNMIWSKV